MVDSLEHDSLFDQSLRAAENEQHDHRAEPEQATIENNRQRTRRTHLDRHLQRAREREREKSHLHAKCGLTSMRTKDHWAYVDQGTQ